MFKHEASGRRLDYRGAGIINEISPLKNSELNVLLEVGPGQRRPIIESVTWKGISLQGFSQQP